jgi:hypothetical protein
MKDSMRAATHPDPIPALEALGRQFELAAARVVLEQHRRPAMSWPAVLAPALVVLVVVMGLSVKLTPGAEALVVRAADRTAASPTGRFTMSTRVIRAGVNPGGGSLDLTTEGVYDRSSGRLRTTVDLGRALGSSGAAASVPGFGGTVETIEDGSTIYLQAPVFEQVLPQHTPWVKVELDALGEPSPLGGATTLGGAVTDPSGFLEALRGMGDDTHVVERVDIDGVATQHYRGTVDLDRAAASLPADERARLRESFGRLGIDQSTVMLPMDVWVDDQGTVRQLRTEVHIADDPANDETVRGAVIDLTIGYRDVGLPEPIVVPPGDQVTDITPMVDSVLAGPLSGN